MKFQTPLLLLAALVSFVSGEEASRSHIRDFSLEASLEARDAGIQDGYSHVQKRNPVLPPGADATKLHVWLRLDTAPMKYRSSGDVAHDGLNTIMKDMGGQHMDVVVCKGTDCNEYGLQFNDKTWVKTHSNGDGAPISAYAAPYKAAATETFTYKGQVKDGRKTLNSIATLASGQIGSKTYNHVSYNCKTFANALATALVG